jgi:hypothetical protein
MSFSFKFFLPVVQGWRTFLRPRAKLSVIFGEIFSGAYWILSSKLGLGVLHYYYYYYYYYYYVIFIMIFILLQGERMKLLKAFL